MGKSIDFFLFLGSTYTYLAVNRAEALAVRNGITLRWRPFSVRTIMIEQNNRPFVQKPIKLAYMWRDIERRAHRHGIPFTSIPNYPNDADELANRVATIAATEGWCSQFARAAYASWFLEDRDPGTMTTLTDILNRLQRNPENIIARANGDEIRAKCRAETDAARALGIFGSPTFVHGTELFWGDDRLEDVVDWCNSH